MSRPASGLGACLFPLLEALGWRGDRASLAEYLGPAGPGGIGEFRDVLAALRFRSRAVRAPARALSGANLPCLWIDGKGAASCLISRVEGGYFAYDGSGEAYIPLLAPRGRGTLVAVSPLEEGADSVLDSRSDWLWLLGGRFVPHLGASLGVSVALGALSLLYPILFSLFFSQMALRGNEGILLSLGLGASLFVGAEAGFRLLRAKILAYASLRSGKVLGDEVFRRLLAFQASFTEGASTEAQLRRVKDLRTVSDFVSGSALAALLDLPFVAIMLVWLARTGGALALVPGLGLVAFAAASLLVYPAARRAQSKAASARAARMDLAAALVGGAEDIAAGGMRAAWMGRFRAASARAAAAGYEEALSAAAISALSSLFVSAGGLATLFVGALAVIEGRLPASALVASMMLVWRVLGLARSTFSVLNQLDSLLSSLRQVSRFMGLPQETRPAAFVLPARPPEGDLQFREVSFRYGPEGYPALYALSLDARRGELTAVEGHQGAGKSTLVKLALGLYRPQAGRVLLGPFNIQQAEPAALRRSIGYVPERPVLLPGLLRDFLRGSSGARDAELEALAERLGLLEALDAKGLDLDWVAPPGADEGKRELVLLASACRAALKPAALYIFDEPRLPAGSAYAGRLEALYRELASRGSVVLVTAREGESPRGADRALILDAGRLARPREGGRP